MPNSTTTTTLCFNAAVRRTMRRLGQLYDDVLAPSGLKATQHAMLAQIERLQLPAMNELAEAMVMDRSALAHSLQPLRREGWVTFTADKQDRRSKRVALTKAGRAKLNRSRSLWRNAQRRFEAVYGAKKAATLRDLLQEIASISFAEAFTSKKISVP
jgi:DNA-binding MarR family transcriptional regulator